MIKRLLPLTLAAASIVAASSAPGQTLRIGDPAPSLSGKVHWIQGEPIVEYQKGHVYVLDFWATWCGPCVASIPTLNKLANVYKDKGVSVVGVAIWPRKDMEPTADFVKEQGDAMSYDIADDIDQKVAGAYMAAAQLVGIPTTMIVDGDGRLAWIGHPEMNVSGALDNILSDNYDLGVVVAHQKEIDKGKALLKSAEQLAKDNKWDESFKVIDQVVAIDHGEFGYLALIKFQFMLGRFGQIDEGYAYGKTMVDSVINNDPVLLENMAKFILEGPGFDEHRDYELAHKAIERAVALTDGKEPAVLDTYAQVCFAMGDVKEAHDAESRAIAQVDDQRVKKDMQTRLDTYAAALEKKTAS